MQKGDYITAILRSNKTVFSFKELALLWRESVASVIRSRINYYVKHGKLCRLRRGLYSKDKHYNPLELAVKIITPSYVSFETVLVTAGVIFQHYKQIFIASYLTRNILCDHRVYSFKKIKSMILINDAGVEHREEYAIATTERAFLDILYINNDYYFDNLLPLNWERVFEILPIYNNKRMNRQVQKLYYQLQVSQV